MKDWEEIVKGKISDEQIAGLKAYDSELAKTVQLVSVLQDDYNVVLRELQKDWDNYLRRRVVVRALFAMVEGAVFALKSQVLLKYDRGDCELSRKEREKLLERKLDSAGNPTDSPRFLPLKDNIKFVFHIYAQKVGDITFRFDFDTKWDDFCDAIEIRNSLTHPKSLDDLNVSDLKLKRVLRAAEWFNEQWGNLMTGVREAIKQSVNAQFQETLMAHAKKALARSIAKASFPRIDEGTHVILLSPDFQGTNYVVQGPTESRASEDVVELRQYPYKEKPFTMGYSVSLNTLVFVQPDESPGSWFRR